MILSSAYSINTYGVFYATSPFIRQAPAAIGPYSQAVRMGNTVFFRTGAMDPAKGELVQGDIATQTAAYLIT